MLSHSDRMEAKSEQKQHRQHQLLVLPVHQDVQSPAPEQGVTETRSRKHGAPPKPVRGYRRIKEERPR